MGFGDSIMLSGIAKRINAMTNQPVCPVDARWEPYWDSLWDGLPYMQKQFTLGSVPLRNAPFAGRQYAHGLEGNRMKWRTWDIAPGEIRLTDEEKKWAVEQFETKDQHPRFLLINPSWKAVGGGGQNKDWGFEKWQEVAWALKDVLLVQVSPPWLDGAIHIDCPTFRHACAILERSIGYVGHEGGMHHAAAALGKPAVVVFGGFISPEVTGYPTHKNLYVPDERYPLGCGTINTTDCPHCRAAMDAITVEEVVNATKEMIQ
jgi:ADP-heptose:LPS heptosyltransferase